MPRNGSGTYSLPQPPFVAGTVISSAAVNSDFSDIAAALTGSLPRDGQAGMQGQFKATDGSSVTPSITFTNEATTGLHRPGNGILGITLSGVELGTFTSAGWTGTITGNGSVPIGSLLDFAGSTAPAFWLLCFGQAISRTTYSALFSAIGTSFGVGDGSTTFNVPDLREYVAVGKGNMGGSDPGRLTTAFYGSDPTVLGNVGGVQSKTLTVPNLPPYTPSGSVILGQAPNNFNIPEVSGNIGFSAPNNGTGPTSPAQAGGNPWGNCPTLAITGNAQGGSSTAFGLVQPSIILNKIIYVGV